MAEDGISPLSVDWEVHNAIADPGENQQLHSKENERGPRKELRGLLKHLKAIVGKQLVNRCSEATAAQPAASNLKGKNTRVQTTGNEMTPQHGKTHLSCTHISSSNVFL